MKSTTEIEFLQEAYKANGDKDNFYERLTYMYNKGNVSEDAYEYFTILLDKKELHKINKKQNIRKNNISNYSSGSSCHGSGSSC